MAFKIKYVYELVDKISPKIEKIKRNIEASASGVKSAAAKMGRAFEDAGKKLDRFGKKARDIGKGLFLKTTLPLGLLARSFVNSASDYQESLNKVDVAFGNSAQKVKDFAMVAGQKFGIDRGSALDMAAMFGDMGTGMGLAQNQAAKMSTSLVGLAGDLASFKNMRVDEVQTALAGIFTGETESLKRLGIVMTETNLQQFALSQGIKTKVKNMKQAEKVLLRYNFIVAKSKNSIGDFTRTSEGYANQQRILASRWKDLSIILGTTLLPYFTKLVNILIKVVERFSNLSPRTQKIILVIGALVAVLAPLLIAFGMIASAIAALASPIGLIVLAIAGLTAGFVYFFDEIKSIYEFVKNKLIVIFDKLANIGNKVKSSLGFGSVEANIATGDMEKAINTLTKPINLMPQQSIINQSQNLRAGGEMNINLNGFPKGSSANMSPAPDNFINFNTGFNRVYQGV